MEKNKRYRPALKIFCADCSTTFAVKMNKEQEAHRMTPTHTPAEKIIFFSSFRSFNTDYPLPSYDQEG